MQSDAIFVVQRFAHSRRTFVEVADESVGYQVGLIMQNGTVCFENGNMVNTFVSCTLKRKNWNRIKFFIGIFWKLKFLATAMNKRGPNMNLKGAGVQERNQWKSTIVLLLGFGF